MPVASEQVFNSIRLLVLFRFHEFLKLETEAGNMTRQESVSMVWLCYIL